jgi:hypothetical protein
MRQVIKIALPGYNAFTDTNPDHLSLYSDEDNVLIKRFMSGRDTLPSAPPNPQTHTINHNLGYIPFYMVYFDEYADGDWKIMNNRYNPFEVPGNICATNTTNLYIKNYQTRNVDYGYDIFYDDMSLTGSPSIVESGNVLKVARIGKSTSSKNPNDYILHSNLNNLKILRQFTSVVTLSGGTNTIAHGADIKLPYKYFCFIKFPDGKTALVGGSCITKSYDGTKEIQNTWMDNTNLYIDILGSPASYSATVTCIIYGTANENSLKETSPVVKIASDGKNALTSKNPDDFNFHSSYPTLKYYKDGSYSMTVSDTTTYTIAHNLGYTPFFIGFGGDFGGIFTTNDYAILPFELHQSSIYTPDKDIFSNIYADDTNIYLKAIYEANAVGTSKTFNYYYKIFKNNLSL